MGFSSHWTLLWGLVGPALSHPSETTRLQIPVSLGMARFGAVFGPQGPFSWPKQPPTGRNAPSPARFDARGLRRPVTRPPKALIPPSETGGYGGSGLARRPGDGMKGRGSALTAGPRHIFYHIPALLSIQCHSLNPTGLQVISRRICFLFGPNLAQRASLENLSGLDQTTITSTSWATSGPRVLSTRFTQAPQR